MDAKDQEKQRLWTHAGASGCDFLMTLQKCTRICQRAPRKHNSRVCTQATRLLKTKWAMAPQ